MSIVYIVQESPGKNLLGANKFGELKPMLPSDHQTVLDSTGTVRKLRHKLRTFSGKDYLLAIGDPVAIGIACAIAAENNGGRFKMLKWDRQEKLYYAVSVDLGEER